MIVVDGRLIYADASVTREAGSGSAKNKEFHLKISKAKTASISRI